MYLIDEHLNSCMKDGMIKEVGRHEELMKIEDGEYARLYNIQASAFIDNLTGTNNEKQIG